MMELAVLGKKDPEEALGKLLGLQNSLFEQASQATFLATAEPILLRSENSNYAKKLL